MKEKKQPLLIWQLTNRGFGSEINVMLLAILYSLEKNMEFALCSKFSNISYCLGWRDYFHPFCEEIDNTILERDLMFCERTLGATFSSFQQKLALWKLFRRRIYLTRDVFGYIWCRDFIEKSFSIKDQGIEGDSYLACKKILHSIWQLNDRTQKVVSEMRASIGFNNEPYFALHVRRGDKALESVPAEILRYVERVCEVRPDIKNCFLMTDDFEVVSELRCIRPDWEVKTLCDPLKQGHQQHQFNALSSESRKQKMEALLTELTIAQESQFFVGTYSSNVCRLMALLKGRENTYGVDMSFTMSY